MTIKHFRNKKTGQVQKVREGSRMHKLVTKSEHFSEARAPRSPAKSDGDGAKSGAEAAAAKSDQK